MIFWILGYFALGFLIGGLIHDAWEPERTTFFILLWPFALVFYLGVWLRSHLK